MSHPHASAHASARAHAPELEHASAERLAAVAGSERTGEREPIDGQPAARDSQVRAAALVAGIAADAAASPEQYLRSTVVPEGGE